MTISFELDVMLPVQWYKLNSKMPTAAPMLVLIAFTACTICQKNETWMFFMTSFVSHLYFSCTVAPITDSHVVATNAAIMTKGISEASITFVMTAQTAITRLPTTPVL